MSSQKIWVLKFLDFGTVYTSEDKQILLKHVCASILSHISFDIKSFSNPMEDYEQDIYNDYLHISNLIKQGLYEDAIDLYSEYNLSEGEVITTPLEFQFLDEPKSSTPIQSSQAPVDTVVNDHVCVSCKNTACNKSEKSCWKCGHPIS